MGYPYRRGLSGYFKKKAFTTPYFFVGKLLILWERLTL